MSKPLKYAEHGVVSWPEYEKMRQERDEAQEAAQTYHEAWQDAAVYWKDKAARLEAEIAHAAQYIPSADAL